MSTPDQPVPAPESDPVAERTPDEIKADLEETREHLAATVDALSHKLDVKTRSREKVVEVKRAHGREIVIGGAAVAAALVIVLVRRRRHR